MGTYTAVSSPHQLGNHYGLVGSISEYVLAQVDISKVALIEVHCGNRYQKPVKVERLYAISEKEWKEISGTAIGDSFLPIEMVEAISPKYAGVCICKKIMMPEIIPNITVGFRYKGETVLCYVQVKKKLRVGVARHSKTDDFKPHKGEKIALRRAIAQHSLCLIVRRVLWENYLFTKKIKAEPDPILEFFRSKVTFNI